MHPRFVLLALVLLLETGIVTAQPSWSGTPIEGGVVSSMLRASDGTIWAIGGGAVFASADLGATWQRSSLGIESIVRFLDQSQDGTLFAAAATLGVARIFRSTDGGASWNEFEGPSPVGLVAFAVTPGNSAIWMFSDGTALWRTTSSGATWAQVVTAPAAPSALACATGPASVCLAGSRTAGGVFKTTDGGATWAPSSTGLPGGMRFDQFAFDPATPSIVYAVARSNGGVFKSSTSGDSWTPASTGLTDLRDIDALTITRDAPNQLAVVVERTDGSRRLYESLDAADSWSLVHTFSTARPTTVERVAPVRSAAVQFVVGTDRGMERSTDSGTTFAPSNSGFEATQLTHLDALSNTPGWIYAHGTDQGPYVSSDGGSTWTEKTTGLPRPGAQSWALDVTPDDPERAVLANEDNVYLTANGGESWTPQSADLAPFGNCGFFPTTLAFSTDDNDLWIGHQGCSIPPGAATSPEVLVSIDEGAHWTAVFDLPPGAETAISSPVGRLIVHPSNPDIVLVSSLATLPVSQTVIRRTVNRGVDWDEVLTSPASVGYLAMAPSDSTQIYLGLEGLETSGGVTGVWKSVDTGATWIDLAADLPCITSIAVDFEDPDAVYIACQTVYQSLDGGATWTDLGTAGLAPPVQFLWLEVFSIGSHKVLMATTNVGIFSFPINGIFADDFESGNLSAWTASSGRRSKPRQ